MVVGLGATYYISFLKLNPNNFVHWVSQETSSKKKDFWGDDDWIVLICYLSVLMIEISSNDIDTFSINYIDYQ